MGGAPPGQPAPAQAHAFVTDLERPELAPQDRRHFELVLRLRPGAPITVSDGEGRWRLVRLGRELLVDGPIEQVASPKPAITIACALVKGERPELVVQKLTELGVDTIVFFGADRSVVRWDPAKAAQNIERLERVAREASMQSRRVRLPAVLWSATFDAVAASPGAAIAESSGRPVTLDHPTVLVGPEGGWSPRESQSGLPCVVLGPHVLRAETAAIAAGALLVAVRMRR
jgi:16S rRNA (uracil1498-N3)-methyltransferase